MEYIYIYFLQPQKVSLKNYFIISPTIDYKH